MATATEAQTTLEDQPVESTALEKAETPGEVSGLVELAIREKVPVEVLERLVALQERVTERNADMAMAEALSAFQAECPKIRRTEKGHHGNSYAPLDEIVRVVRPVLNDHGLSYTHDSELVDGDVVVVCTLRHQHGATRTATFRGPIDTSGGKNPIQQVASARSYGRRYSLTDVLGIITEEDDDGAGAGGIPETIGEDEIKELNKLIGETDTDVRKFCTYMGVEHLGKLTFQQYPKARRSLERKAKEAEEEGDE